MIELVHPNRPETWKNSGPPFLDPFLVRELEGIGGRNIYGEPNLRFVWGQTRTQFRRGKERLLYIDERIPEIRHTRHVLKRTLLVDAEGTPTYERKVLTEAPRVVPKGWLYELELDYIEWIGQQLWFVEQWYPPEKTMPNGEVFMPFGTPAEWEAIRYEDWEDPEIGMVIGCDVLGPFPSRGRYSSIFVVGQPFSYLEEDEETIFGEFDNPQVTEHGTGFGQTVRRAIGTQKVKRVVNDICYRPPGRDTIEAIRAGWHERENRVMPKAEQRERDILTREDEKRRAAKEERLDKARAFMRENQWRWSSPDTGTTGGVGGGARAYIQNTDALEAERTL
jgi:hypothetical protein